jgi:hypothetical protein
MKELTEAEIAEKYSNIEDKIPSVWKTFEEAGINLAQDIACTWDVRNGELIRVLSLIDMRMAGAGKPNRFNLTKHINPMFAYAGLYPERMKSFNILPDGILEDPEFAERLKELNKLKEELLEKRKRNKLGK